MAELARELGIELLQAASVNEEDALERIRAAEPEAILVCAFGQLINEPLLSLTEILNVHPSLLPRWRGAAPIERAIMARDPKTGVCVMRLTAGLDSGPVALRAEVAAGGGRGLRGAGAAPGGPGWRPAGRGARPARRRDAGLHRAGRGGRDLRREDHAPRTGGSTRREPAADLAAKVRALTPHIGAYLELEGGERLGVRRRARSTRAAPEDVGPFARGRAASCVEVAAEGGALLVGTGEGSLRLDVVQPAGGKPMTVADYLRGRPCRSSREAACR